MVTAALEYGRRGWAVLPLHNPVDGQGCSCQKGVDCSAAGKHPRLVNGLSGASCDPNQIEIWWTKWPLANVGLRTGAGSGLLVVDVDGPAGQDSLTTLAAQVGELPSTLTATTGRGMHLYFEHPGVEVRNSAGLLGVGLDVRGERGYVVAVPSLHATLSRYAWVDSEAPLAKVPQALLERMSKPKTRHEKPNGNDTSVGAEEVSEGSRNDFLFKLGCKLRGREAKDHDAILAILLELNVSKCRPPLEESEVNTIATNVCQHPAEKGVRKSARRMQKNPLYWFQFNINDWFSDQSVMLMSDYQLGWSIQLKAIAWQNGGFLSANREVLWRLARAKSKKAFERDCGLVLNEYEEVIIDGEARLRHSTLAPHYANVLQLWTTKMEAGEKSRMMSLQLGSGQRMLATTPQLPTARVLSVSRDDGWSGDSK